MASWDSKHINYLIIPFGMNAKPQGGSENCALVSPDNKSQVTHENSPIKPSWTSFASSYQKYPPQRPIAASNLPACSRGTVRSLHFFGDKEHISE